MRRSVDKNAMFLESIAEAKPFEAVNVPHGLVRVGELELDKSIVIRGEPGAVLEVNGSIHIKNPGNSDRTVVHFEQITILFNSDVSPEEKGMKSLFTIEDSNTKLEVND